MEIKITKSCLPFLFKIYLRKKYSQLSGSTILNFTVYIQGGPKKGLWINLEEKCLKNYKKKLWSLSLYILTSSQEVRAF